MRITRTIPQTAVAQVGGLVNGVPPIVPDDIADRQYTVVSCEPMINKHAYEVVYEVEDDDGEVR